MVICDWVLLPSFGVGSTAIVQTTRLPSLMFFVIAILFGVIGIATAQRTSDKNIEANIKRVEKYIEDAKAKLHG